MASWSRHKILNRSRMAFPPSSTTLAAAPRWAIEDGGGRMKFSGQAFMPKR